jgi:hypothetical protein
MEQIQPLALVVLIPKDKRGDPGYHALHERLRSVARQKGVDFFCEFFDPSSAERIEPAVAPEVSGSKQVFKQQELEEWNVPGNFDAPRENRVSGSDAPRPVRACSAMPKTPDAEPGAAESDVSSAGILSSVTLSDINAKTRRRSGLPNDCEGVVVACIDSNSAAFKAGLRAGDVIQQMDQQVVRAPADAVSLSHKAKGKNVLLRVWSQGDSRFLVVNRAPVARAEKPLCQ